jgi:hypothetical protein
MNLNVLDSLVVFDLILKKYKPSGSWLVSISAFLFEIPIFGSEIIVFPIEFLIHYFL